MHVISLRIGIVFHILALANYFNKVTKKYYYHALISSQNLFMFC
jgi:hypothetical protein